MAESVAGGSNRGASGKFQKNKKKSQPNTEDSGATEKRPFDKAKWRETKYNKQLKVDQWQQRRQKTAIQAYQRVLKKEGKPVEIPAERLMQPKKTGGKKPEAKSGGSLTSAQKSYWKIRKEKKKHYEEIARKKAEQAEALAKYAARKTERFKKLSGKTKRGQPLMRGRIELMLEQIVKMTSEEGKA